jgi:hypothetical protein
MFDYLILYLTKNYYLKWAIYMGDSANLRSLFSSIERRNSNPLFTVS